MRFFDHDVMVQVAKNAGIQNEQTAQLWAHLSNLIGPHSIFKYQNSQSQLLGFAFHPRNRYKNIQEKLLSDMKQKSLPIGIPEDCEVLHNLTLRQTERLITKTFVDHGLMVPATNLEKIKKATPYCINPKIVKEYGNKDHAPQLVKPLEWVFWNYFINYVKNIPFNVHVFSDGRVDFFPENPAVIHDNIRYDETYKKFFDTIAKTLLYDYIVMHGMNDFSYIWVLKDVSENVFRCVLAPDLLCRFHLNSFYEGFPTPFDAEYYGENNGDESDEKNVVTNVCPESFDIDEINAQLKTYNDTIEECTAQRRKHLEDAHKLEEQINKLTKEVSKLEQSLGKKQAVNQLLEAVEKLKAIDPKVAQSMLKSLM